VRQPSDPRIPVRFAPAMGGSFALLREAGAPPPPPGAALVVEFSLLAHRIGCACCGGRPVAALAFDRLFLARVKGDCPWFDAVHALPAGAAGRAALIAALDEDRTTRARFRRD